MNMEILVKIFGFIFRPRRFYLSLPRTVIIGILFLDGLYLSESLQFDTLVVYFNFL